MSDPVLFLGFPVTDAFQQELSKVAIAERERVIQDHSSLYLQRMENEGTLYLGKALGSSIDLDSLEAVSAHLHSLLKTLVPHFPYGQNPVVLLGINSDPS